MSGVVAPHNGQLSIWAIWTGVSPRTGGWLNFFRHHSRNRVQKFMEPRQGIEP